MRITHTLELPAEVETVPVVRALVRQSLLTLGVVEVCVDDIALALTEACANVVAHASDDGATGGAGGYLVEIRFDTARCEIEVVDHGPGLDTGDIDTRMPPWNAEHGRGFAIIETVMDAMEITSEPERGTVVTFSKALQLRPGSQLQAASPA